MTYVLKHQPEDFIVEEVAEHELSDGPFIYVEIKKRDLTTYEAIKRLASALRIREQNIRCAGNKDRVAVTTQVCSVERSSIKSVESVSIPDMSVRVLGSAKEPVRLGLLKGNKFTITVRDLDEVPKINTRFRNLFGEQRFGRNNAEIGKLIIQRKYDDAAKLANVEGLNGLRKQPKRLVSLYVHAYQSVLWNKMAEHTEEEELPIIGFGTEVTEEIKRVLDEEGITIRDFIVRDLPGVSAEGGSRNVFVEAEDVTVAEAEDEYFPGKKKVVLQFFLPKGCYATEFIRQNFS